MYLHDKVAWPLVIDGIQCVNLRLLEQKKGLARVEHPDHVAKLNYLPEDDGAPSDDDDPSESSPLTFEDTPQVPTVKASESRTQSCASAESEVRPKEKNMPKVPVRKYPEKFSRSGRRINSTKKNDFDYF